MPKLISFDIGIRNLAYCILDISNSNSNSDSDSLVSIVDWNVMDLSEQQKIELPKCNDYIEKKSGKTLCLKTAKYCFEKDASLYFCEKHAKKSGYLLPSKEFEKSSLKKMSMENLSLFLEKWKIDLDLGKSLKADKIERILEWVDTHVVKKVEQNTKKKGATLDFIQIGRNLANHLSKLDLENIQYVVIENQISPIANKMRTIQGMVAQMFILQNVPVIEFVSSSNKLKDYLGKKENGTDKAVAVAAVAVAAVAVAAVAVAAAVVNPDYKQHKKDGIHYTREWLDSPRFGSWKSFFDTFPKKQDDLADAFLQGIWYIRKKLGVTL